MTVIRQTADVPLVGLGLDGLYEAHVQTTDFPRAMAFYGETLHLPLAYHLEARNVAFYWLAENKQAMLGVWGVTTDTWHGSHVAFRIRENQIDPAVRGLNAAGVTVNDFFGNPTDDPSVHAWMPAVGIFFRDPDGNSLELVAVLPGEGRPDVGVVPLSTWYARYAPSS